MEASWHWIMTLIMCVTIWAKLHREGFTLFHAASAGAAQRWAGVFGPKMAGKLMGIIYFGSYLYVLLYVAYVSSLWWLNSKDECPKRGGNCTGFYNAASEVLEHCFGQIVLVIIVKQIYPDSKEGRGTQTSIGQWQGSEWAYEMGNIITGISGKFHLPCFPFDPNGILQLIKFLNFNEVQCINLPPYLILCVC